MGWEKMIGREYSCDSVSRSSCTEIDHNSKLNSTTVANHDTTLIDAAGPPKEEPPVLKGYLNKYTNIAKGYRIWWFVLKNGVLSSRHRPSMLVCFLLSKTTQYL